MRDWFQKALLRNRSKLFLKVNVFLVFTTVVSILSISLETVAQFSEYSQMFNIIEFVAVLIFTIEFFGRLYAKDDRRKYVTSFYGVVDLLSILPTFFGAVNFTFLKAARFVRLLQFLRMSRIAKLARLNKFSNHNSLKAKEIRFISIKIYGLVLLAAVFVFGTLLYFVESQNMLFKDIPSAVMWTSVTILGGNVDPHLFSLPAKLLVVCLQFSSLLLFGLLIAIVGRFTERKLLGSNSLD